ncbi:MAG: pyridoxamine 5'-phosphate oxidase family protein [Gammaproteobacteria bacterium]|nr:pyridoxamine 5'-phosphate oxidase family protein [Gammaproteobacteria bacterium]
MTSIKTPSPFHPGEHEIQERTGVREKMELFGRRVIRDHMPDQHRQFYAQLPYILIGSIDTHARPWASIVTGEPGFISTPDSKTLSVASQLLHGDPLNETIVPGGDVGVLGIEFQSRRRNRMNGKFTASDKGGFEIQVGQSFGNCPQYIQSRLVSQITSRGGSTERSVHHATVLGPLERNLIEAADTLFIATHFPGASDNVAHGVDVSHRGGKPGFVRVDDDRSISWPDFAGNYHFNSIGNLTLNPRAGHLFIDFETGDLLYMTGEAEVIWDDEEVKAFVGAERIIRFHLDELIRVEASLPIHWRFEEYSPILERTGSWKQASETISADKQRNTYQAYDVFKVEKESNVISSFYLRPADGKGTASFEAGQFLPIQLPGQSEPVSRTYTVSDAPNSEYYRLSVKREGGDAVASNFFHDHVKPGYRLQAMAPRGKFTLDQSSNRPVVLISGGVGITPMIAMLNFMIKEGIRTRQFRETYFIHGAQNAGTQAFGKHVRAVAAEYESVTVHIRYSKPSETDRPGIDYDSLGHVDVGLLMQVLPFGDHDFYLCGSAPFMQAMFDGLTGLGVRDERIHYESFGPATVLKHDSGPKRKTPRGQIVGEPVKVCFIKSGIETEWSPDKGTLLEMAEASGLSPGYSCRTGICGTCATQIKCGSVDYMDEPIGPREENEVLICCSTPRSESGDQTCGEDCGVILDL